MHGRMGVLGALGVMGLVVACAVAPLWVYSVSLAGFGLAHVAVELRYVEARFRTRLSRRLGVALIGLLALVAGLRVARLFGLVGSEQAPLELGVVALLIAAVTLDVGIRSGVRGPLAVGVALVVALGATLAPVVTLLGLAVLHNWTPLGFLAEATRGAERRRWMVAGAVAFLGLPALLASGLLQPLADAWGLHQTTPFDMGPLWRHLGVYLPRTWHASSWAVPLFSAIVLAQCLHYVAVLGVLPRYAPSDPVGPLTRLSWPAFLGLVGVGTAALLAAYVHDFGLARQVYGVVAALHAWVELPILFLALGGRPMEAA